MFDNAVKIKCDEINLFQDLSDDLLPGQLELTINGLKELDKDICKSYLEIFGSLGENTGYIFADREDKLNFFENENFPSFPGRSISSRNPKEYVPMFGKNILMGKGTGFRNWLVKDKNVTFVDNKERKRKYPILVNRNYSSDTQRILGGGEFPFLRSEYLNAVILNALIKRHNLCQFTYYPIKLIKPKELVVLENDELKIVDLNEYSYKEFKNPAESIIRIPDIRDLEKLAQFYYAGTDIDLRIPPESYKDNNNYRFHLKGQLEKLFSKKETETMVNNLRETLTLAIKTVHFYKGSFTEPLNKDSSLKPGNVAVSGFICDLDTLSFNLGEKLIECQKFDILFAERTINNLANVFGF